MKQNNCILIGLTGGIATGKSTVTKLLIEKGYTVIDADEISRTVVEVGKPAYKDIVETFGLRILMENKSLNRKKLGRLIFSSTSIRETLNRIVHPRVFEEIKIKVEKECESNKIIFLDIPLLFEVQDLINSYNLVLKETWMVYTDEDTQLERLIERDKITKFEAMDKINSQINVEEKRMKSTKTLYNNGDLDELEQNLNILISELEM